MKKLIDDELQATVELLLPKHPVRPKGGRPFVDDRAALTSILFVLRSGIPWAIQFRELVCRSGATFWRRLRAWQRAGVWDRLHAELLRRLARADRIDWSRAALDALSVLAKKGRGTWPEPG